MKQRMQGMLMGILVTVFLIGTVTVFAATPQTIEVIFGGVRTTLFGQEFVVRDDDGLVIESITYNDRVYIPVDTVLHAMGANVQWNDATSTLNFGTAAQPAVARERTPLRIAAPIFDSGGPISLSRVQNEDSTNMGGIAFRNAISYNLNTWANRELNIFSVHNLNGQHRLLTGHVGRVDGSGLARGTVRIIGDGNVLATHELRGGELPTEISVLVEGIRLLRIEFTSYDARGPRMQNPLEWTPTFALVGYLE